MKIHVLHVGFRSIHAENTTHIIKKCKFITIVKIISLFFKTQLSKTFFMLVYLILLYEIYFDSSNYAFYG
jgi:hypothetical protein